VTTPPQPDERAEILELYKLAVEMADRVSARRGTANAFFLSVQTAFIGLVGFGFPKLAESPWWAAAAVALAGVTLSGTWWLQLRSYRDLNTAKFQGINKIEEHLPVKIFADEWDALRRDPIPAGASATPSWVRLNASCPWCSSRRICSCLWAH
jgi:hypothetical protein